MNKFFLYLVMLPSGLWRSMGADTDQLRAILNTRLLLDDRKPLSMMRQPKQKKDRKYGSLANIFISFVMGLFYTFPLFFITDRIFSLTVYFTTLLTILTFMLITDFSSVLFDSRDKYIIFPRPVNDRTIVLSRLLHVFIYLFRIVLPMALPGWIVLGILDGGKSAMLFILPLLLLVFMALFIVNGVYLLVLRLAKPERFKDVINYFQVFASILFFATFYLLPRFFDEEHGASYSMLDVPWMQYFPSYWLAVCWSWVGAPVVLAGSGYYSSVAVLVPLACLYVLVKHLAPQFSRRIAGIDTVETGVYDPGKSAKRTSSGRMYQKLAHIFNTSDHARAGFMIGWLQSSRSRSFRMRVYPSFACIPIYFVYLLSNKRGGSFMDTFHHLRETKMHLMLMYMSAFVMITALNYLTMSDQYKAAWVYYSSPVETPGKIMIGAFKALMVKYFLPFFLLIASFVIYIWGAAVILDVLLAFANVCLFVSMMARINFRHLPFSTMEQMKQSGNRILKSFLAMIVPFALGVGHYFAMPLAWLKIIFLALSAIMLWLIWESYGTTSWANMMKSETE